MVDIASWVYYYCLDTTVFFSITPRFFHGVPSTVRDNYSKSINIVSTRIEKKSLKIKNAKGGARKL